MLSPVAALVVGCSSGGSGQTGTTPPVPEFLLPDVANPVNATVAVEPENAVMAPVPVEGGTLTTMGSDGTVYTLTIPMKALLDPVTITMTPIRSVAGVVTFPGRWIGVRLEPEGLRFYTAAALRMIPPEGEGRGAFAFSAYGDGRELHGQPLLPDGSRLEMPLFHFSVNGAQLCGGDCGGSLQAPLPNTPTDWEARLQNFLENEVRMERERQQAGRSDSSAFWATAEAVLREYFIRVIEPMLPRIMTDCGFAEANLPRAIAFNRQIDVFGSALSSKFSAEQAEVQQAVMAAIENCLVQTAQPCIDPENLEQVAKLNSYFRVYVLLTGTDPQLDPRNPSLHCGRIWTGTSRVRFSATGDPSTNSITMSASFVFEVDDVESTENITILRPKSGSVNWEFLLVDGGCTTRGGPHTFTLLTGDGTITLFASDVGATFTASGELFRTDPVATYLTTCADGRSFSEQRGVGGTWLYVPDETPAFPEGRGTMTGAVENGAFLSEWSFSR